MNEPSFRLDDRRRARLGVHEAILCEGKSDTHLGAILTDLVGRGGRGLFTRLDEGRLSALPEAVRDRLDYDPLSRTAWLGETPEPVGPARIGIVAAGTSDLSVCAEAVRTLAFHGHPVREAYDVGVAGLWRLLERVDELADLPVLIVAAGMDAALPSVLAGLHAGLLIAVPTSTGYGVAAGGRAALDAVLASCAPGLLVVNIDNGFGAACAAIRALALTASVD